MYVACISRYLMEWEIVSVVEEWLRVGVEEGQLTVLCQGPREPFYKATLSFLIALNSANYLRVQPTSDTKCRM
jgi:hypothetical protein